MTADSENDDSRKDEDEMIGKDVENNDTGAEAKDHDGTEAQSEPDVGENEASDAATGDEPADPETREEETAEDPVKPRKKRGGGFGLFLTFLIAVIALAGTAWQWLTQQQADTDLAQVEAAQKYEALADRLSQLETGISGLDAQAAKAETDQAERARTLARIERELQAQADLAAALPARMARVENAVTSLPTLGNGANRQWQLAAAENYMQVANSRLLLAGEVDAAALALSLADESIRDLADPAFSPIRALLSDEIAALRSVPVPDIEGVALRLASLARELPTFPMREGPPDSQRASGTPPEDLSGIDRALAMLKQAFSRLISVRRTDQPITPQLTTEEQRVMASAMVLDLQLASLAAMRGDGDLYADTVLSVRSRFAAYFDGTSPKVMGAMYTLAELAETRLDYPLPDISGSLALLRQQRSLEADPQ